MIRLTKKRVGELVRESLRYGYFATVDQSSIAASCKLCGERVECAEAIYDYKPGHVQRKLKAGLTKHLTVWCGECDRCGVLYEEHADDCPSRPKRTDHG